MPDIERPSSRAAYLLALSAVPGVGPWTAVSVMRAYPEPAALFVASPSEREQALGRRFAGKLASLAAEEWPALLDAGENQVTSHQRQDVHVIAIDDDDYPPLMRLTASPAAVLYVRGGLEAVGSDATVAVIGTREPTANGVRVTQHLTRRLGEAGFVVVSGLAAGIDRAGHEGALEAGAPTVAILGTAIDKIYPARHKPLAAQIVSSGGALISEYPAGFPTSGRHFVERDRLQAAMSIAVIAVQTGLEGGTLHTVRFAREAHRAILVPKPIEAERDHPMYGGIHALVDRGAASVIETQADYPRLFDFLQAYRAWLRDRTVPRPTFGDGADRHLDDAGEQSTLGL